VVMGGGDRVGMDRLSDWVGMVIEWEWVGMGGDGELVGVVIRGRRRSKAEIWGGVGRHSQ